MKPIRRHLRRAQAQLNHTRGHLLSARRRCITKGCGSACISALSQALAENHHAHEQIDDIATMLEATNPHFKPRRQ